MEWVEVQGKTVELAVGVALQELGLETETDAEIEVVQDPQRGFLGIGGRDAIVRVKPKPKQRKRARRGRSRRKNGGGDGKQQQSREGAKDGGGRDRKQRRPAAADQPSGGGGQRKPQRERNDRGRGRAQQQKKPAASKGKPAVSDRNETTSDKPEVDIEEQAQVVQQFLRGLLDAFGLEGNVATKVEDNAIYADVSGDHTEALVGNKGAILQAVLELTRTVVQRKTHSGARIRLDIAGYAERRRQALQIYAQQLADQVLADGGELMLEPMNPADRKVVHDAVADIDGVRSYSEGEEPNRSVIIGLAPGVEPSADGGGETDPVDETAVADEDE